MRNKYLFVSLGIAALAVISACTVKDIDQPSLSGPSTLGTSIIMTTSTDSLIQDGASQAVITIRALDAQGKEKSIPLRAEIRVDNVVQDFGRLSTKQPVANGTPLVYTAPPPSAIGSQLPQTVQIVVTPSDNGDFNSEVSRAVDIRLVPQGIILPTNPTLIAEFKVTSPTGSPQAFQNLTFDAGATTNAGVACGTQCAYSWDFGDGSSGTGMVTTHLYRSVGSVQARLTVTDARGSQATSAQQIVVGNPSQPSGTITTSPSSPGVNQDILFNASQLVWQGRSIASYDWNFGDGSHGSGVTTTHRYGGAGTFAVSVTLTDTLGAQGQVSLPSITISALGGVQASLTIIPASPKPGQRVVLDASASQPGANAVIVEYKFDYGDGSPLETSNNPVQSHVYSAGNYVAAVTITDSLGRTATKAVAFEVKP